MLSESQLISLCDEFQELNDESDAWEFSEGADGQCETASMSFVNFLAQRNVSVNFVVFLSEKEVRRCGNSTCYKGKEVQVFTFKEVSWYQHPIDWPGHVIVKVGEYCIDWTARQFHRDAPFPFIFRI